MVSYYLAKKVRGKWQISHRLDMPDDSCKATADGMKWALFPGDRDLTVLYDAQVNQKNVVIPKDVPVLTYDARKYWESKLKDALHSKAMAEMVVERAAAEGIELEVPS